MAAEAQRATRSREQTNSPPRIPASKSSLAYTFTMCRREGVAWHAPVISDHLSGLEELLDRLDSARSALSGGAGDLAEEINDLTEKSQRRCENIYQQLDLIGDQMQALRLLGHALTEHCYAQGRA
jgi:hypothetical protein